MQDSRVDMAMGWGRFFVRRLADGIIESQVLEIAIMEQLLEDIGRSGRRGDRPLPPRTAAVTPEMQPQIDAAVR